MTTKLLVQNVCDDPDHTYHSMDCGPDLEKVRDLTRPATPADLVPALIVEGGEVVEQVQYGRLGAGRGAGDYEPGRYLVFPIPADEET